MEGNFLAFTVMLRQPNCKQVKTFFIGKMSEDKIVGTFVDDVGIRGEWAATRLPNDPSSR